MSWTIILTKMYNRDQFAMAAMQGLIAAGWQTDATNSWAGLAKEAYRIADEMMKLKNSTK